MGKTLLQKPSSLTPTTKLPQPMVDDAIYQQTTLKSLLKEMDTQLANATSDLLQPRQQAIDAILKKARS